MSIKLMSEVWACELAHADQAVLLVMADHARDDGTRCFPSVGLIAWKTGLSERSVQYALRRLEVKGVLVRARTERPGQYQPLEYTVQLKALTRKAPFAPKHARPGDVNPAPRHEPPQTRPVLCAERSHAGAATLARLSEPPVGQAETARSANDNGRSARLAPLPRPPGVQTATARGANDDARGANGDTRGGTRRREGCKRRREGRNSYCARTIINHQ
jgi:hypothetical protein